MRREKLILDEKLANESMNGFSSEIIFNLNDSQTWHGADSTVVGQKRLAVAHQCSRHLDRIGRLEFKRCSKVRRGLEKVAIDFDEPQTSAIGQQRLILFGKGRITRPIRYNQDFHQTEAGCHRQEIAAIDRFEQRLYEPKVTTLLLDKIDKSAYRARQVRASDHRSIPLAPFPVDVLSGVNLFPDVLSKPLEFQNGERGGIFRRRAKNMNNFLGHRSMFPMRACLNFFVQAIRQIFDIQSSHRFLQNATIMEETRATVKYRTPYGETTLEQLPMFELVNRSAARSDRVIR